MAYSTVLRFTVSQRQEWKTHDISGEISVQGIIMQIEQGIHYWTRILTSNFVKCATKIFCA